MEEEAPASENENTISSQVGSKEVGNASESNDNLTNENGQTGVTASQQGSSKGL